MGFVDDEDISDTETTTATPNTDEETALLDKESSQDNGHLTIGRLRRATITETQEIWEELENDDFSSLLPPFSPIQHTRR
ncbi:MAG: hypothetical protein Q9164_007242, partial [Protoblastenia rupestris]